MRIEILEGDEYLYEDGKARNIILVIDGKRMIMPTNKTIQELCDIVKKLGGITPQVKKEIIQEEEVTEFISDPNIIQRGDIVKYIGEVSEDNRDLTLVDEYVVIPDEDGRVSGKNLHIMSKTHPVPIRLVVKKEWVKLLRKNTDKPAIKKTICEAIVKCDKCQQEVALILADSKYTGKCLKCGAVIEKTQEEIAPTKVEL